MEYSILLLKTKDDCNALLSIANEDKAALEFRKVSLERHRVTSSGSSISIETDLQTIQAQIALSESIIAGIPDGDTKDKEITKLKGLDYRRSVLTQRKKSHGIIAVLQTEYDIESVVKDIATADSFIEAINNRLNGL